jgi:integrase
VNLLATVFKYAERTGLIEKSPVEGMGFIPRGKGQDCQRGRLPFPVEDVPGLLSALKKRGDETMWRVVLILFHSGMRLEEAGGLRGRDVQEREGVWGFFIEPSVSQDSHRTAIRAAPPCAARCWPGEAGEGARGRLALPVEGGPPWQAHVRPE